MGEVELVNAIRDVAVDAVRAREKPMTVQVGVYLGSSTVRLGSGLEVSAVIPRSVGTVEVGDNLIILKQEGQYKYFVVARI